MDARTEQKQSGSAWGGLSIQDRIKAMSQTLETEDAVPRSRNSPLSAATASQQQQQEQHHHQQQQHQQQQHQQQQQQHPPTSSLNSQQKSSVATEETADLSDEECAPRRASVVDMWRKREEAATNKGTTPKTTPTKPQSVSASPVAFGAKSSIKPQQQQQQQGNHNNATSSGSGRRHGVASPLHVEEKKEQHGYETIPSSSSSSSMRQSPINHDQTSKAYGTLNRTNGFNSEPGTKTRVVELSNSFGNTDVPQVVSTADIANLQEHERSTIQQHSYQHPPPSPYKSGGNTTPGTPRSSKRGSIADIWTKRMGNSAHNTGNGQSTPDHQVITSTLSSSSLASASKNNQLPPMPTSSSTKPSPVFFPDEHHHDAEDGSTTNNITVPQQQQQHQHQQLTPGLPKPLPRQWSANKTKPNNSHGPSSLTIDTNDHASTPSEESVGSGRSGFNRFRPNSNSSAQGELPVPSPAMTQQSPRGSVLDRWTKRAPSPTFSAASVSSEPVSMGITSFFPSRVVSQPLTPQPRYAQHQNQQHQEQEQGLHDHLQTQQNSYDQTEAQKLSFASGPPRIPKAPPSPFGSVKAQWEQKFSAVSSKKVFSNDAQAPHKNAFAPPASFSPRPPDSGQFRLQQQVHHDQQQELPQDEEYDSPQGYVEHQQQAEPTELASENMHQAPPQQPMLPDRPTPRGNVMSRWARKGTLHKSNHALQGSSFHARTDIESEEQQQHQHHEQHQQRASTPTEFDGHDNPYCLDSPKKPKNHFVQMGQKHAARSFSPRTTPTPGPMFSSAVYSTPSGPSTPMQQSNRIHNSNSFDARHGGQNDKHMLTPSNFNLAMRKTGLNLNTQTVTTQQTDPSAKQVPTTPGTRAEKKKQLVMARYRNRKRNTGTPVGVMATTPKEDDDATEEPVSDTLSLAMNEAVPEDQQRKLSGLLSTSGAPTIARPSASRPFDDCRPSIPVDELLSYQDESAQPTDSVMSEYTSLCVSDSGSFMASEHAYEQPPDTLSPTSVGGVRPTQEQQSIKSVVDNDTQSFVSATSAFSGLSQSTVASSALVERARKALSGQRQRKHAESQPPIKEVPPMARVQPRGMNKMEQPSTEPEIPSKPQTRLGANHNDVTPKTGSSRRLQEEQMSILSDFDSDTDGPASEISRYYEAQSEPISNVKSPSLAPTKANPRNYSFDSQTTGASSQMPSTVGGSTIGSESPQRPRGRRRDRTHRAGEALEKVTRDMVPDEFVTESASNVNAFQSAYQSLSLGQIANDLNEVAGSVAKVKSLDFHKLASDFNSGMSAASDSLNKLVGKDVFSTGKLKVPSSTSAMAVDEGVAIEVEYIEDFAVESPKRKGPGKGRRRRYQ